MVHGTWCNAKTVPMTCKYCGSSIFYFFCDCGCKTFFEELGEPWPRHYCVEYQKTLGFTPQIKPKVILHKKMVTWELIKTENDIDIEVDANYGNIINVNISRNKVEKIRIENRSRGRKVHTSNWNY